MQMEGNVKRIPWKIKRERCALIVVDMQNE